MRKLIVTAWISLDGYVAGPDNDMSWVGRVYDAEMGAYETAIVEEADTLLLGRTTYESFAGSWPHVAGNPDVSDAERAYARRLNAMRKLVVSTTLQQAEWEHSAVIGALDPARIEALKTEAGGAILVYGSVSVVRELTRLGLVDEYQLLYHPVLLGGGKRLFGDMPSADLKLATSVTHASGVVRAHYVPTA